MLDFVEADMHLSLIQGGGAAAQPIPELPRGATTVGGVSEKLKIEWIKVRMPTSTWTLCAS